MKDPKVQETARKIAALLADLEAETGLLISDLSIDALDVTVLQDTEPQYRLSVLIETYRKPGHQWDRG
jgi:hypothetical protein